MSTLTVLELMQEFCGLMGLPVPSALVGSNDQATVQYRATLNAVLREAGGVPWPEQKIRRTYTSVASADQGALATLFPGFSKFVPNTLWLSAQTLPIRGPVTDQMYAALKTLNISGPPYSYWLSEGHFYLTPTPPAGQTVSAIYQTNWKYYNGSTPMESLSADSDTVLIPDEVILSGLQAIWKKNRGQAFEDDWNIFQGRIARELAPSQPTLALDNPPAFTRPGIIIPPGSWLQ